MLIPGIEGVEGLEKIGSGSTSVRASKFRRTRAFTRVSISRSCSSEAASSSVDVASTCTVVSVTRCTVPCTCATSVRSSSTVKFTESVGYPVVIKPPAGVASQVTHRAENAQAVRDIIGAAKHPLLIEEFVTGCVAQTVIDDLEVIQVNQDYAEDGTGSATSIQKSIERRHEKASVERTSEWVPCHEFMNDGVILRLFIH